LTEGSTGGVIERLRVSGFGCNALRIWSAETLSPAMARPAVSDSAAPSVIAVKPESLRRLVMVLILAGYDSVWMLGRYDGFD
jgi:hypothetical protein